MKFIHEMFTIYTPWDEVAHAIKQANYTGRIVMEHFTKIAIQVGHHIGVWRDLSDNADEKQMDAAAKAALGFVKEN